MKAFVDGDVLIYMCGFTTEDVHANIARARLRDMIRILTNSVEKTYGPCEFEYWVTDGKDNFRRKIFPDYKMNRVAKKPIHHEFLQNTLLNDWGAHVAFGEEADDAMSIRQYQHLADHEDSVICSIDKDLLQVPGHHYNWVKKEPYWITPLEGIYRFYLQLLTGDATDNITPKTGLSCPKVGDVKARRILEGYDTEEEMFQEVYVQYHLGWKGIPKSVIDKKLLTTGQLLRLRTEENEIWSFPTTPRYEEVTQRLSLAESQTRKSRSSARTAQAPTCGSH